MAIAVLGEALIDFLIGDDGAYRPHLGGSPYNVAVGLARQGVRTTYLSSLSDDCFGDQLRDALVAEGVELPLQRRSLWPTSLALVTVNELGQPSYRLYREGIADKDTSVDEVVENLPPDLRVFHTGSLAITPSQLPKIRAIFQSVRERGILISMDINIRLRASIDTCKYIEGVLSLLREVDIVKASDEDIAALNLDQDPRVGADKVFAAMEGGMLVLTEGSGGAVIHSEQGLLNTLSYPVAALVDTVGAGDTFHAAFLSYLYRRKELSTPVSAIDKVALEGALDFACAAAAINVSRAGCSPPTEREVLEFIAATTR